MEGKITQKMARRKMKLLRVSGRFELARVHVRIVNCIKK